MLTERERQKELARERLAARRKKRDDRDERSLEEQLRQQQEEDHLKEAIEDNAQGHNL